MKAGESRATPEPQSGPGRKRSEGVGNRRVREGEIHCLGGHGREVGVSGRTESVLSNVKCCRNQGMAH